MKHVFRITIAVTVLALAVMGAANAAQSETAWRFTVTADNGTGGGAGTAMQIGIATAATDGPDMGFSPIIDQEAAFGSDLSGTSRWAVGNMNTAITYSRDIKSPASPYTYPNNQKIWNLRIAALPSADALPIRLVFRATSTNPSPTAGGLPIFFELKMINNRGVAGAPANGTKWSIPLPTGASGSICWQMDTALDTNGVAWGNLPMLKLTGANHGAMLAQGYEMAFTSGAAGIPEPSGTLTANIIPSEAVVAGAQWRVVGLSSWLNSGYVLYLPPGNYTVEFKDAPGWKKPTSIPVIVAEDQLIEVTGTYEEACGSLRVTIEPPAAVNEGARWRRGGTADWLESGETEHNIPVGEYDVEFSDLPKWFGPAALVVPLTVDETTEAAGTYVPGEDFESGDFSEWPWQTGGNAGWTVTSYGAHQGAYAARSGAIGDSQTTFLEITLDRDAGDISFFRRVSSELGYDSLRFRIDGVEKSKMSGETGWGRQAFAVAAGSHTYRWEYTKDATVSEGEDAAWLDYIAFPPPYPPPAPTVTAIEPNSAANTGTVSALVTGTGFTPGSAVKLARIGDQDIAGTVLSTSDTEIACTLDLTGRTPGLWSVVVTNLDAQSGVLIDGFTIADIAPPVIASVEISPQEGDLALVEVDVTDNVGVTSVTANGAALANTTGSIWTGVIPADREVRSHTVTVTAGDAAGNTAEEVSTVTWPVRFAANGNYYDAVPGDLSWSQARALAEQMSHLGLPGHLTTITSAEENTFVAQTFPEAVAGGHWLGGYQDKESPDYAIPDAAWNWVTVESWNYTNWKAGEPNDLYLSQGFNDDALALWWESAGTWNDCPDAEGFTLGDIPHGYLVEYEPDNVAPNVAITGPTSDAAYVTSETSVTVSGEASDNVDVVAVTWINDRGGSGTCTGVGSWTTDSIPLQQGPNVITVSAQDSAGNVGTDLLIVTLDLTPPEVAISEPSSGPVFVTDQETITLSGTASDASGVVEVTWSNDQGGSGTCSGTDAWTAVDVPLAELTNVITISASDLVGNVGTAVLTVMYPAPEVHSVSPDGGLNGGSAGAGIFGAHFVGGAAVKLAKVGENDCLAAGVAVVDSTQITCTFDLTGLTTGVWDVVVTNADGQSGVLPGGFTVYAGIEPPVVTDDGRYTGELTQLHALWTHASGVTEYQYSIQRSDGTVMVPWTSCGSSTEETSSGLSLQVGETYYWLVKGGNRWGLWSDAGTSDGITAAYGATIAQARSEHLGGLVFITDAVVTSAGSEFPGLWVTASDRSAGLFIPGGWATARGDNLRVGGVVEWVDGVPVLTDAVLDTAVSGLSPKPLALNNRDLTPDPGERLQYDAVSPVGMLVTTWGKVNRVDTAGRVFYVDDGGGLTDGMGPGYDPFIGLRVAYKSGMVPPAKGKYVLVTGIRSVEKITLAYDAFVNGEYRFAGERLYLPVIVLRGQADIVVRK